MVSLCLTRLCWLFRPIYKFFVFSLTQWLLAVCQLSSHSVHFSYLAVSNLVLAQLAVVPKLDTAFSLRLIMSHAHTGPLATQGCTTALSAAPICTDWCTLITSNTQLSNVTTFNVSRGGKWKTYKWSCERRYSFPSLHNKIDHPLKLLYKLLPCLDELMKSALAAQTFTVNQMGTKLTFKACPWTVLFTV